MKCLEDYNEKKDKKRQIYVKIQMPFGPFSRLRFINYSGDFRQIAYNYRRRRLSLKADDVSGEWPINGIRDFLHQFWFNLSGKLRRSKSQIFDRTKKRTKKNFQRNNCLTFNLAPSRFISKMKPCGEERVHEAHVITANNIDSENSFGGEDMNNSFGLIELNYDQLSNMEVA